MHLYLNVATDLDVSGIFHLKQNKSLFLEWFNFCSLFIVLDVIYEIFVWNHIYTIPCIEQWHSEGVLC